MIRIYDGQDLEKVLVYYGLCDVSLQSKIKIVCPFHGDINPSMSVDFANGRFFCFGCGLKGNALDFVKYANPDCGEIECMMKLEKIVHSEKVCKLNIVKKERRKAGSKILLYKADDYFYGLKEIDWNHVKTDQQKAVREYMRGRGFNERALNVSDCRVSYNEAYPIIFPILDNGVFSGWVSRTTSKLIEQERKYLYNKGFRKRDVLCGQYEENAICYVCEGFLDYLSLKTRGKIKNVVAFLGWHASDRQIDKLKNKNINTVVCALDNPQIDKSGEKGLKLLREYFNVIPFPYPKGKKDPGEMSEEQIQRAVRKVKDVIKM